jgi:FMN phosphatase YigB (HAD superfamily)
MAIRYVCFDLGGVVVRICHSFVEAVKAAQLPLIDEAPLLAADAIARRRDAIWAHQVGEFDFSEYCQRMSLAVGGLYDPAQVRALHAAWLIEEYPGVLDLVTELDGLGHVRLACLSNTNDGHWDQMQSAPQLFPTLARLHVRLASHLMRLAKPDPAIYQAACTTFECTPAEVLFFDDLPENIEAARAAGWNAERIDPTGDTAAQMRKHLGAHGVLGAAAPSAL